MTSSNDASGYVSKGPTSSGGASGGESRAALFTSRCGAPHSATTSAVRGLDRRPVGDVHARSGGRSSSPPGSAATSNTATRMPRCREAVGIDPSQLAEAAGDDGHATGRGRRARRSRRASDMAFQTASQNSRTQPSPPARASTQLRELARLGPGVGRHDGKPDGLRHSTSLTSLPTYATRRGRSRALPPPRGAPAACPRCPAGRRRRACRARALTTGAVSIEMTSASTPASLEPAQAETVGAAAADALARRHRPPTRGCR